MALLTFILYLYLIHKAIRLAIAGKGLFRPDFDRIDEYYPQDIGPTWNSTIGKVAYYLLLFILLITIFIIAVCLYGFFS